MGIPNKKITLIVIIFVFILDFAGAVSAETLYVPDDYLSIQSAVDAASSGDIIIVRKGTYIENIKINKSLIIKSEEGPEKTVVKAKDADKSVFTVWSNENVTISGFSVEGANREISASGIELNSIGKCNIINNVLSNNYAGIGLVFSNNNVITNNNISNNTEGIILVTSDNNKIYKNNIKNNFAGLIEICSGDGCSKNNKIYLNNFKDKFNALVDVSNLWNSPEKITYTYKGSTYTNYLGNYWSYYDGDDADEDGIGDKPYIVGSTKDNYPLIEPFENYLIKKEAIFSKKAKLIEKLENYGLDESNSKDLLDSLWEEYNNSLSEEICKNVERMDIGESITETATEEGVDLSNSIGKSALGVLWSALIVPELVETILKVSQTKSRFLEVIIKITEEYKLWMAEMIGVEKSSAMEMEDKIYDIITSYQTSDEALKELKGFRNNSEKTISSFYKDSYLNKGGIFISIPILPNYEILIPAPSIKSGVEKLNKFIREDKLEGTSEEAKEKAETYSCLIDTTGSTIKNISENLYYYADLEFVDDTTKHILKNVYAEETSEAIKKLPELIKHLGKVGKKVSTVFYLATLEGKILSGKIGLNGLGIMGFEHLFGEVDITNPNKSPSIWSVIIDPKGSNLQISNLISEDKQKLQNLSEVLNKLYESAESGNITENVTNKYLNISEDAIKQTLETSLRFENVTSICASVNTSIETRSNFSKAIIDLVTKNVMLISYLYLYFETANTTILSKIKNQINETKESVSEVERSLSKIEHIIKLWIPVTTKNVPASKINKSIPIQFTIYNIGTSKISNLSVNIKLPEFVNTTKKEWNITEIDIDENITLESKIIFNKKEDFILEIIASGPDYGIASAIYINVTENAPPIADANGPYKNYEGSSIIFNASNSLDPNGDILQYRWDLNNDGIWDTNWSTNPIINYTWNDDYIGKVKLEVSDGEFTSTDSANITVENIPPIIETVLNQTAECCLDIVLLNVSFTDPGLLDTHTAKIDWGDGTVEDGIIEERNGSGNIKGIHKYCTPGNYTVSITIIDDDGGIGKSNSTVIVVDTYPPEVNISSPEEITYLNTQEPVTINYTVKDICDSNPEIKVYLDGKSYAENSINLGGYFGETKHTLKVVATDKSGNTKEDSATFKVVPKPMKSFLIKKIKFHSRKHSKDSIKFTILGSFELPEDYKRKDLDKSAFLYIKISEKEGRDKVKFKELRNFWFYHEPWKWKGKINNSLNAGINIKRAFIYWSFDKKFMKKFKKNLFYIEGELFLKGIDTNLSREAIVSLEIPIKPYQKAGSLGGKEKIEFKKFNNYFLQ